MAKRSKGDIHPASDKTSSRVFHALASDPRRTMLIHLSRSSLTAGEIAARFDMAKPSISQHLSILENAELIEGQKKGQYIHYRLKPAALRHALQAMLSTLEAMQPGDGQAADVRLVTETADAAADPVRPARRRRTPAKAADRAKPTKSGAGKAEKPGPSVPAPPQQMGLLDLLGMEA